MVKLVNNQKESTTFKIQTGKDSSDNIRKLTSLNNLAYINREVSVYDGEKVISEN
jgi:hypothetical protein